jgi:hypothetical protein
MSNFVPVDRQPGRSGIGVMVVVQFLAADEDAPGGNVGAGVRGSEVPVAPEMPEAVDHPCRPEGNPGHLHHPDQQARQHAEDRHIDGQHDHHAKLVPRRVQMILDPVVRCAMTVALQGFSVPGLLDVEEDAGPQHPVDADDLRAVRILGRLALGVMLAVDRRPLLGHHAGGQPQPETEEMCGQMGADRARDAPDAGAGRWSPQQSLTWVRPSVVST